jgi:hypothetical protein
MGITSWLIKLNAHLLNDHDFGIPLVKYNTKEFRFQNEIVLVSI